MASTIDYTDKFTEVGGLIAAELALVTLGATTLPAQLATILTNYGTSNTGSYNAQSQVAGLSDQYQNLMNTVQAMRLAILGYVDNTLTDYDSVVSLLAGASSADINTILPLLITDMFDRSITVKRSITTLGAVTADILNVGNGTIILDATLDGYQPGVIGGLAHYRYAGLASELAPATTNHAWTCSSDSYSGGTVQGGEGFSWGDGVAYGPFSSFPEGAGQGPGLTAAGGSTLLAPGDFENWSSNVPSGWTVGAGAGIIRRDTTNFYTGASSVKFVGNGSTPTAYLKDAVTTGTVNPLRRYLVSFRAYRSAGAGASGTLFARFQGTGYNPGLGESVSVAAASLTGSWALYHFWLNIPAAVPSDFNFRFGVEGTLDGATVVNVDSLWLQEVNYHAGIDAVAIPGSIPFVQNDRFYSTATAANGIIQNFFRLKYGAQLPSAFASGDAPYALLQNYLLFDSPFITPTLPDSLA